ncbi:unnamed protein product, partial [Prorocentrum cordatum]
TRPDGATDARPEKAVEPGALRPDYWATLDSARRSVYLVPQGQARPLQDFQDLPAPVGCLSPARAAWMMNSMAMGGVVSRKGDQRSAACMGRGFFERAGHPDFVDNAVCPWQLRLDDVARRAGISDVILALVASAKSWGDRERGALSNSTCMTPLAFMAALARSQNLARCLVNDRPWTERALKRRP